MPEHRLCPSCGEAARPRLNHPIRPWLAAAFWIIPIGFLSQGYWPFLSIPALLISYWAWVTTYRVCPRCGLRPPGQDKRPD
ncbi:MAG: hypothetical protein PVI15_08905 [Chromatiales bacterium]